MKYLLALPITALLFSSCRQEKISESPSADPEIVALLEDRLGYMERRISQLNLALEESADQQNTIESLRADIARLEEQEKAAEVKQPAPAMLNPEPTAEIDPAKVRSDAVGESLGTVHTLDGRTFYDARIANITDVGIEVQHRDGSARLHFSGLSPEIKDRFFYVPALAQKALNLERLAEAERSAAILQKTLTQLEEEKERREKAEKEALEARIAMADQPVHHTTQIIVDEPIYHDNRPLILSSPYRHSRRPYYPPVVRVPLVRNPVYHRPVSAPVPPSPRIVRPQTTPRPGGSGRPVPSQRR